MDLFSASDAFLELYVRHSHRHKTAVAEASTSPVWNEQFTMPVRTPVYKGLYLYDRSSGGGRVPC
jgi:Ca2+-dependent lipid-binding protein